MAKPKGFATKKSTREEFTRRIKKSFQKYGRGMLVQRRDNFYYCPLNVYGQEMSDHQRNCCETYNPETQWVVSMYTMGNDELEIMEGTTIEDL
jgi:hypothetical protein